MMPFLFFKIGLSHEFKTAVYVSQNPLNFGMDDEKLLVVLSVSASEVFQDVETFYISSLMPQYDGVMVHSLNRQFAALKVLRYNGVVEK